MKKDNELHFSKHMGYNTVSVPPSHELYGVLYKYNTDKSKNRKVEKGKRRIQVYRSVFNWIEAGNELPENYKLVRIDGNRLNDDISNLRCIHNKTSLKLFAVLGKDRNDNSINSSETGLSKYPPGFNDTVLEMVKFQEKYEDLLSISKKENGGVKENERN